MNIIHILGITILFGTYSVTEETRSKQRILLRKLLSVQKESKPMWNEVLADVLVNKIRIFSFKKPTETESITDLTREKTALTNFVSQVFFVYKKFVYDVFVGATEPTKNSIDPLTPEIEERHVDPDDVFKDPPVTFSDGPKGEVELLEPRYHGKQILKSGTEESDVNREETSESAKVCPEGTVIVKGDCVNKSKLLMRIPYFQCPSGYQRDGLGYCRMIF